MGAALHRGNKYLQCPQNYFSWSANYHIKRGLTRSLESVRRPPAYVHNSDNQDEGKFRRGGTEIAQAFQEGFQTIDDPTTF